MVSQKIQRMFALTGICSVLGGGVCSVFSNGLDPDTVRASASASPVQDAILTRKRTVLAMGTDLVLEVNGLDSIKLDAAIDAAILEFRRIEDLMTDWRPSELTRLNDAAGLGDQVVPRELAVSIQRSLEMSELTAGAFDATFAPVGKLWKMDQTLLTIPTKSAIERALGFVGWEKVVVELTSNKVSLPTGMSIGLGGIAKGYAVDRAMRVLLEHGVKHGMVSAGGDMKVLGDNRGEPWEIAIKHPRNRETVMASIRISNVSLVTSGDYERFFVKNGKRYHHIIDPRTGSPSEGCLSATVIAPQAEFADALATAACVMGSSSALQLIESLDRVEGILVGIDGEVRASSGLLHSLR